MNDIGTTRKPRHVGLIVFFLVVAVFILPPTALLLMLHFEPLVILQTGEAGTFKTAASHDDLTNVRTSTGTITVKGGFSALDGQRLLLRRSNKLGLQLCSAGDADHCAQVSGPWTGRMRPVPHPQHWYGIDFAKHGINPGTLPAILAMGCFTALAALMLAAKDYADAHPNGMRDEDGDHAHPL